MEFNRRTFGLSVLGTVAYRSMHACAGDVSNESTDLVSWSATKIAKHVLERKVASVEVVTAFINRIKQIEPKINAVNYLAENEALSRAKKADEALASGQIWGPLHGVPISILVHGRTNNPYDLNCTPGGSSGGEAALIASMGSPLGIGTDAGGSIRGPSS